MAGGGLPRGRTTLLVGGAGSGKTILALQFLVHGARSREPGIFVGFEESSARVVANTEGFGWKQALAGPLEKDRGNPQPAPCCKAWDLKPGLHELR